jgi:acyl-CoA dehydrogenase
MEVLAKYGTPEQKSRWLLPLLAGKIRSAFAMTEPAVASSDATNIETSIRRDGASHYVINGRKWWTSGAGDPRLGVFILMGKTDPGNKEKHKQQSMIIVPANAPGIKIVRMLSVFGYDEAPEVPFLFFSLLFFQTRCLFFFFPSNRVYIYIYFLRLKGSR